MLLKLVLVFEDVIEFPYIPFFELGFQVFRLVMKNIHYSEMG